MTREQIFLRQLKSRIHYSKVRLSWAVGWLAERKKEVRQAERELKKWTKAYKPKKRAKK